MLLLNSVIKWLNIKRTYQIQYYRDYPLEIQNESLLDLLKNAAETEWGKSYNYSKIASIKDFKNAVPLQNYDDIKPFVDRLRKGEKESPRQWQRQPPPERQTLSRRQTRLQKNAQGNQARPRLRGHPLGMAHTDGDRCHECRSSRLRRSATDNLDQRDLATH